MIYQKCKRENYEIILQTLCQYFWNLGDMDKNIMDQNQGKKQNSNRPITVGEN